jgi:hypothetical protein
MTKEDLELIEQALAISLPDSYRRALCPFPIPGAAGNTDASVWDDARALVGLNQRLRAEVKGWPRWLFAIGQAEGDPCGYAIDTRSPESQVWWLDQMRLGRDSGPTMGPFTPWFSRWVAESCESEPIGRPLLWFLLAWLASVLAGLIALLLWIGRASRRRQMRKR